MASGSSSSAARREHVCLQRQHKPTCKKGDLQRCNHLAFLLYPTLQVQNPPTVRKREAQQPQQDSWPLLSVGYTSRSSAFCAQDFAPVMFVILGCLNLFACLMGFWGSYNKKRVLVRVQVLRAHGGHDWGAVKGACF